MDIKQILLGLIEKITVLNPHDTELTSYLMGIINNLESKTNYRISDEVWENELFIALEEINKVLDNIDAYEKIRVILAGYSSRIRGLAKINEDNFPLEYGIKMESIYFNPDYIIGIHGTSMAETDIENKVFNEGLFCAHGADIKGTVALKDKELLPFDRFMRYYYKPNVVEKAIIVRIPVENKNDAMWRKDDNNNYYLSPNYIYGYYVSHYGLENNEEPVIIENPNYGLELDENYDIPDEFLSEYSKNTRI